MPRNLELEAAAFADLDDLDSWRVYADWLLSHGDARGEIASLAVHLGDAYLSERKPMAARIEELQRPFVDAWLEWARRHDLLDVEVQFKRGFVFAISGELGQLQPVIDALFERHPIQRLTLTGHDPDMLARLLDRRPPWLQRLRYLKLHSPLDETALAALADVELPELRRLNLRNTELDANACKHLARLQTRRLEHLTLSVNSIGDAGLALLLRSPTRGQWRELYLSRNPIDADGLALLAADQGLALTGLYLCDIAASFEKFAPFTDRAALPTLTTLEVASYGAWQHDALLEQLRERFGAGLLLP
jgi:hypothetical protein